MSIQAYDDVLAEKSCPKAGRDISLVLTVLFLLLVSTVHVIYPDHAGKLYSQVYGQLHRPSYTKYVHKCPPHCFTPFQYEQSGNHS